MNLLQRDTISLEKWELIKPNKLYRKEGLLWKVLRTLSTKF